MNSMHGGRIGVTGPNFSAALARWIGPLTYSGVGTIRQPSWALSAELVATDMRSSFTL
jgi:hypothetical protein